MTNSNTDRTTGRHRCIRGDIPADKCKNMTALDKFSDLEEDIIMTLPPPKKYTIELTITKITKGKLRFII